MLGLEEFLRVSLKIIFKTAHCTIAEAVHKVPLRLCCLLLNELLPKINKPYDTTYVSACQQCEKEWIFSFYRGEIDDVF